MTDTRKAAQVVDRNLPHEIEAERAALGSMLLNPEAVQAVMDVIRDRSDAFYAKAHAHIYSACLKLVEDDIPVDEITLTTQLRRNGTLEDCGGIAYIAGLTIVVPTSFNARAYAVIVLNAARQRLLIEKSHRLHVASWEMHPDEHARFLSDLALDDDAFVIQNDLDSNVLGALDPPPPLWTRGPSPGSFSVIAGESGSSKSYLMLSIAVSMATGQTTIPAISPNTTGPVIFLAYEDGPSIMLFRLRAIAEANNIQFNLIEEALVSQRLRFICNPPGPLFSHEKSKSNTTPFFHSFQNILRDARPVLTIIDPLSGAARLASENSNAELSEISQHLTDLANCTSTAIVLLHHANKTGMADGKPMTIYNIRGAKALIDKTRWTSIVYGGNEEGHVVLDIQKNNYYGVKAKIPLVRGKDGALIPSHVSVEAATAETQKKTPSKPVLRGARMLQESDRGFLLEVQVGFPESEDVIRHSLWWTRKNNMTLKDGDEFRALPWLIGKKEEQIAVDLGIGSCNILVGPGELCDAEKTPPTTQEIEKEEELF